jgi:hypothetical protein|tara:strand:- start:266 stop:625 length:360 start_codon:yes stop_codon:yes gene_type:complete
MTKKTIVILFLSVLITACSSVSPGGYYWGKYSYTYHALIKEPSTESRANHQETLLNIIAESQEQNLRVPPGIHAELGNLLALNNQTDAAVAEFETEVKLYPESKVFLERLLSGLSKGSE